MFYILLNLLNMFKVIFLLVCRLSLLACCGCVPCICQDTCVKVKGQFLVSVPHLLPCSQTEQVPFLMFPTEYIRLAALESLGSSASASHLTVREQGFPQSLLLLAFTQSLEFKSSYLCAKCFIVEPCPQICYMLYACLRLCQTYSSQHT